LDQRLESAFTAGVGNDKTDHTQSVSAEQAQMVVQYKVNKGQGNKGRDIGL
jgi:hypothetical protein